MTNSPPPHPGRGPARPATPAQASLSTADPSAVGTPTQRFARAYAAEERAAVDAVADGRALSELQMLVLQHRTARLTNALKAHVGGLGQYHDAAKKVIDNI